VPRLRYKDLWLKEQAKTVYLRSELDAYKHEVRRVRAVLADYAEKELVPDLNHAVETTPEDHDIALYPIGMEGLRALMIVNSRRVHVDDIDHLNGVQNFEWKGRKLVCRP
jgi:hypothetical protein